MPLATSLSPDYATNILSIKTEISQLKQIIAQAVEQLMHAIKSIHAPSTSASMDMETDDAPLTRTDIPTNSHDLTPPQPDIQTTINELKNKIATITQETRAMFRQLLPPTPMTITHDSSGT